MIIISSVRATEINVFAIPKTFIDHSSESGSDYPFYSESDLQTKLVSTPTEDGFQFSTPFLTEFILRASFVLAADTNASLRGEKKQRKRRSLVNDSSC